jgi:hypothetical protein
VGEDDLAVAQPILRDRELTAAEIDFEAVKCGIVANGK